MTALEQGERQLEHPSFSAIECEFLFAFWHWASRVEPILIIAVSQCFPPNDDPSPTAGTGHARAQNAIGHSEIIKVIRGQSGFAGPDQFSRTKAHRHMTKESQRSYQPPTQDRRRWRR